MSFHYYFYFRSQGAVSTNLHIAANILVAGDFIVDVFLSAGRMEQNRFNNKLLMTIIMLFYFIQHDKYESIQSYFKEQSNID